MNEKLKLFVVLLGGRPDNATIEQHNVFFGIAYKLEDLYGAIKRSWMSARKVHIDAYMCVDRVNNYDVVICEKNEVKSITNPDEKKLFFVNLGFYKEGEFAEIHKIRLEVASSEAELKTALKKRFKEDEFHLDDCHMLYENIEVEIPDERNLKSRQFVVSLRKANDGSFCHPEAVIGYKEIP